MRFAHVTISVKDLEESQRFYNTIVGLPVTRRLSAGPGREIIFLGNEGETEVELIGGARGEPSFGQDISLGFEVESLDRTMQFLRDQGIDPGEVQSPNPSVKMIFIRDPNGLRIQFLEQAR